MCPKPHEDLAILLLLTPLTPSKPHFLVSWGCLCGSQGSRMWMASFQSAEQMSPCMTGSAPGSRRRTLATQSPAPQAHCTRNTAPKGGGRGGRMIKGAWSWSLGGALCEVTPGSEPTSPRGVVGAEGWGLSPVPSPSAGAEASLHVVSGQPSSFSPLEGRGGAGQLAGSPGRASSIRLELDSIRVKENIPSQSEHHQSGSWQELGAHISQRKCPQTVPALPPMVKSES